MRDMPVWDEHVAKLACPNDRVHAYLDDIVILNRPERASAACDCVTRAVATHAGVSANLGKTRVYHPCWAGRIARVLAVARRGERGQCHKI